MIYTIAFIVVLVVAGGGLLALFNWLINLERKRAEMTEEEFENRERGANLIGVGMMALDEILRPEMKKAIEYRIDAEQGHLPGGKQDGEGPEPRSKNHTPEPDLPLPEPQSKAHRQDLD